MTLFRWLHEEGHINSNPAAKIKESKVGKSIPKFLTEREIEHLRDACLNPMEKALFEFMFSTGCRIGEIVTLNKNSINWTDRSLKIYINNRIDKDPAIFVTERDPHRMSILIVLVSIKQSILIN